VIDPGTQNSILAGKTAPIGIVVDGADSKTASVGSGYASQIIAEFNRRQLGLAALQAKGPSIDSQVRVVFNPSLRAVNTMIPGLVAFVLLLSMAEVMGQAVVRERARGTLEQMFVTPMTRGEYLLGKVLPYAIIASIQASTIALVGKYWFKVPFNGNVLTVALGIGLFMLTSIGIGLLISLVSRTQQQAQQAVVFVLIPTMILSGFVFPIEAMPPAIVPLTYLIPMRYALVVLRGAFLKGASIGDMWQPLLALAVCALLIFGIAVATFSKKLSE
jgi:ABC-2 type transport system permease protein